MLFFLLPHPRWGDFWQSLLSPFNTRKCVRSNVYAYIECGNSYWLIKRSLFAFAEEKKSFEIFWRLAKNSYILLSLLTMICSFGMEYERPEHFRPWSFFAWSRSIFRLDDETLFLEECDAVFLPIRNDYVVEECKVCTFCVFELGLKESVAVARKSTAGVYSPLPKIFVFVFFPYRSNWIFGSFFFFFFFYARVCSYLYTYLFECWLFSRVL